MTALGIAAACLVAAAVVCTVAVAALRSYAGRLIYRDKWQP